MATTNYRITTPRPVGGRMRRVGDIVALTDREAAGELQWGGLEPANPETATAAATGEADAADQGSARKRSTKA